MTKNLFDKKTFNDKNISIRGLEKKEYAPTRW
jgi:hypothetical protein